VYSPDTESNPCCPVYVPNASGGVEAYPGVASGIAQHFIPASKVDFAPRLSVVYSPNDKTAIRAGYGIFYVTGASYISSMLLPATGSGNGGLLNV
jgi:hypothetical protein